MGLVVVAVVEGGGGGRGRGNKDPNTTRHERTHDRPSVPSVCSDGVVVGVSREVERHADIAVVVGKPGAARGREGKIRTSTGSNSNSDSFCLRLYTRHRTPRAVSTGNADTSRPKGHLASATGQMRVLSREASSHRMCSLVNNQGSHPPRLRWFA